MKHLRAIHFMLDARLSGPLRVASSLVSASAEPAEIWTCGRGELSDRSLALIRKPFRALFLFEVLVNTLLLLVWLAPMARRREKPVLHVHAAQNFAPLIAGALLRLPTVWHFHSTLDVYGEGRSLKGVPFAVMRAFTRALLKLTRVVEVSVARQGVETWRLSEGALIEPNPIDGKFWSQTSNRSVNDPGNEWPVLVCVANFYPLKGQDLLLDALQGVELPCQIKLIGATFPVHASYAEALRNHPEAGRVEFCGPMTPEQVREALADADAYLMPSRSEAYPMALLEAGAMGLPCVASDVGETRNILGEDWPLIVEAGNANAFAEGIRKLLTMSVDERQQLGERLRSRVLERSDASRVAARFEEIYASLAGPSGPGS